MRADFFGTLIRTRRTLIRPRVCSSSYPSDQLQPQGVRDPRRTQLRLDLGQLAFKTAKLPVRIRTARNPDCNSSRSTISCSHLQPQSVRVQDSSCPTRIPAQLEVHSLGGPVSTIYKPKGISNSKNI
ncbi:hypothetical protein F2Q68_00031960 [Brassica cretica]|uniref:Uncharacterized protein n=1 Tax=Brassica cretica TaxID=69181 RepID=A0A8S9G7L7_BRACR|nr:hypothetical protein F2Q68_00031960 [Brassica cretica]